MNQSALITGNSSGLGLGLSQILLERGWEVFGTSRRGCPLQSARLHDIRCDLTDGEALVVALESLLEGIGRLDLVVLNAGISGPIQELAATDRKTVDQVMEINLWSNKAILDWLIDSGIQVGQVVAISSGASVSGALGWGTYAISKAALNMMVQLYAAEMPQTHFTSLAPGIIDTAMQAYLCEAVDETRYPSVIGLQKARQSGIMPDPLSAGRTIADAIPRLLEYPSGSYQDIRKVSGA